MKTLQMVVMFIVWMIVIPSFAGVLPTHFVEKKGKRISSIYLTGWLSILAIFEVIGTVVTIIGGTLSDIILIFSPIVALAALAGAMVVVTGFVKSRWDEVIIIPKFSDIDKKDIWTWALFAILLILQIVLAFFIATPDADDSSYIANALAADLKDSLFRINPYTGEECNLNIHTSLSMFPIFYGFLSRQMGVHAAFLAHKLMPPIFIILSYVAFYKVATELLRDDKTNISVYMVLISGIQLFGASSPYSNEVLFLTRTWQGKSIFANMAVPAVFYILLRISKNVSARSEGADKPIIGYFVLLAGANLVGIFASVLGALLLLLYEIVMFIVIAMRKRYPKVLFGLASLFPCVIYILLYLYG